MDVSDAIVEGFRNAAFGLGDWSDALRAIGDATGSHMAQLAVMSRTGGLALNFVSGASNDQLDAYFLARGDDPSVNPRTQSLLTSIPGECVTEADILPPGLTAPPIYDGLFRLLDVPHAAQIRLDQDRDSVVGLIALRSKSAGEHTKTNIDLLKKSALGMASAISAAVALGATQDRVIFQTAEALGNAVIILGRDGKIISASSLAVANLRKGGVLTTKDHKLIAIGKVNAQGIERAISAALHPSPSQRRMSRLYLSDEITLRPIVIDICPLPISMSGPLSQAQVLLTIRERQEHNGQPDRAAIAKTYCLTLAESDVALQIAQGKSLREIAILRRCSIGTVRSQLKAVFEKTGSKRQVELALLLNKPDK